jgi:radical SAM superfamily enzyme YgiQ (UPF0313 family)
MLPYWYVDKRMAPCSVRTLADTLDAAGFRNIRVVLQQWTPNFRPSAAELAGGPLDVLLVSAMQVHAEPAFALIRDAHRMGRARPLVLAGGPKFIYEPLDCFEVGPEPGIGADCAVTGEAYVLLSLLDVVLEHRMAGETMQAAFDRARCGGALDAIPGLVYLAPEAGAEQPVAVNTGVQHLLRDLDEMPLPDAGYRVLEPPHRHRGLRRRPLAPGRVGWRSPISSLISTHGCKFNCSFCPIPAANQRTWRHKSPSRLAAEIRHIHEQFGISSFFGTDDNFFNDRNTVIMLMEELARTTSRGKKLGERIEFYTEATEFDVHRNQDILPLCREGGMRGIWFGLEDVTAELINKGQTPGKTRQLFARLHEVGIQPMAMMIHSDGQPLRSPDGDLSGLINQARYLFDAGAVSYQCTYLGPAIGTRDIEPAMRSGNLFRAVGSNRVPDAFYDGNHVVASSHAAPWKRQINVLRAYLSFYNPYNALRCLAGVCRGDALAARRLLFQIIGHIGLAFTVPRHLTWARRLKRGPIETWTEVASARMTMIDAASRKPISWALDNHVRADVPAAAAAAARSAPAIDTVPAGRAPEPRLTGFALDVLQPTPTV